MPADFREELATEAQKLAGKAGQASLTFLQLRARFFREHLLDGIFWCLVAFAVGYLFRMATAL